MKLPTLLAPSAGENGLAKTLITISLLGVADAFSFNPAPSPNLDLSQLGRIGLAGDFAGVSLYKYQGQHGGAQQNGNNSILGRYPDGGFGSLASSDGGIQALCPFVMNGHLAGVIVGGNFTSLGGLESQGVAMFNPNTSEITALPGISGQVNALYCDDSSNTVYVGGSFKGANSTNAIAWVGTDGWTNLPFLGFNGPVVSIDKHKASGKMIFGGSFTGLGNATILTEKHQQVINFSSANISATASSSATGFSDPKNIVCKTGGQDGAGNTWLADDNEAAAWKAEFEFGFQPTKLTLWNTHQDGRGTKTWRYTAQPINGIMNFTYVDPADRQTKHCTSECPLSNDPAVKSQDFFFINNVGMNGFQIDISGWYGAGAGLNGIQLSQNDIYAYAIDEFNEPQCVAQVTTIAKSTSTGNWRAEPSHNSTSKYLTAQIQDPSDALDNTVVFYPHIRQSGNYSVNMYTPGCLQDNTCATRGRVNVTGIMGNGDKFEYEIYQSNNYDKYDQIYFGYIEAGTADFRPTVTLAPSAGQPFNLTVVAQRVGFTLIDSTGGLNSLYEYDPKNTGSANVTEMGKSTIEKAGMSMGSGAGVKSVINSNDITFVGGNYTTDSYENILAINNTDWYSLSGKGLDGPVSAMWMNDTLLYVGGEFSSTSEAGGQNFSNICYYHIEDNKWKTLGAGVNGKVSEIVPIMLNISGNMEQALAISGDFDQINASADFKAASATGLAIWLQSRGNWLQNLDVTEMVFQGKLTAALDLPNDAGTIYAGSLTSSDLGANGAAMLSNSDLSGFPVKIERTPPTTQSPMSKRATASNVTVSGVVTGKFYEADGLNVTVLGGHFGATATDGKALNNLVFLNSSNSDAVTGIPSLDDDSVILAMEVEKDVLFAGGIVTGTANGGNLNGLITYNLKNSILPTQPPALVGESVVVYEINSRESTGDVYVAGAFDRAGALPCPAVCVYSTTANQWNRPGSTLDGTVYAMTWQTADSLIVGGQLSVGGNSTYMATYDAKTQEWKDFSGASGLPGPVVSLTAANKDTTEFWVAGVAGDGSTFLMKYQGDEWKSVQDLGPDTTIRGLQILTVTEDHDESDLMPKNEVLILTGSIGIVSLGSSAAALYNGTTFQPYILASPSDDGSGYLSQFFSQRRHIFPDSEKHLALGFVVLIGLAIALVLIFLMVVAGIIAERVRRKREGYMPAPTNMYDKSNQMSRLPPEQIFGTLNSSSPRAPAV